MRVLYVSHTGVVGGAEHSLLTLLEGLPPDVEPILASPPGALHQRATVSGVRVIELRGTDGSFRLHPSRTVRALLDIARSAAQVRVIAHQTSADLIHANSVRAGLITVLARATGGPPTVVHVRDVLPQGRAARAIRRVILRGARCTICISQHVAYRFVLPGSRDAVVAVHNGVDLGLFDPDVHDRETMRESLGLTGQDQAMAVLAQITPWKGQDNAVAALAAILPTNPTARLFLIGEAKFISGDTRLDNRAFHTELIEQAQRLGIDRAVELLGERHDVPALLHAMDIVLVPSLEEPFGRSVIEAMAMERAVIATNTGGPVEIIDHGVTGLLAPPRDVEAWSRMIRKLLDDRELRAVLGRRARASLIGRFDQSSHVTQIVGIYRAAINVDSSCGRGSATGAHQRPR
ncbi:MAG: glycosyltransferase family 4 protein [Solirubrobacteraceae bacterium]|nr:glycosyltransferase family 4 protein [Solirubrobacteraceae bacterium]